MTLNGLQTIDEGRIEEILGAARVLAPKNSNVDVLKKCFS